MHRYFSILLLSLLAVVFFASPGFGQITGDLQIVVSDATGAARRRAW